MKVLAYLVALAVVAGLTACGGGNEEARGPASMVAESLGTDSTRTTETERECMRQHLRANPMVAAELRRARSFTDLDAVLQSRVYEALGPCLPTSLGRAVLRTFVDATGGSDDVFVSDSQAHCVSVSPLASKWLVDMRYAQQGVVMTRDEMMGIVTNLYLCARDVVVNGPLSRALDVDREHAACIAGRLEQRIDVVPEVASLMFGQLELEHSAALEQVISQCRPPHPGDQSR